MRRPNTALSPWVILAAALPFVSVCSTAPAPGESGARVTGAGVDSHRIVTQSALSRDTLQATPAQVWRALQFAYQEMDIPVTGMRENPYRLETMNLTVTRLDGDALSTFLDCGSGVSGPRVNTFQVALTLVGSVLPLEEGGTVLQLETDAWARPRGTSGSPVHCESKNELEDRIFERVTRRLGGAG